MELFCGTKNCTACKNLQEMNYLRSPKAAEDRLNKILDKKLAQPYKLPVIDEVFDWEFDEWVDNELSLKGEPV